MAGRLKGKRVIVTGAASGIGRASARLFAREGARVLIVDWAEQALEETSEALRAEGLEFLSARADSGSEEDVRMVIERAVSELGGLDALFANAGIARPGRTLQETTVEQFQEVLRVNLLGPFLAIKYGSLEIAKQGKGAIVCTASVAGLGANAGPIDYSASKAALINLVRTAAHDLRGTGVRVNAICPGLIQTGMTQPLFELARLHGFEDKVGHLNPLQRAGQSEEIAAAALFLLSDESSYVDGHALVVDGGLTASGPYTPMAAALRK